MFAPKAACLVLFLAAAAGQARAEREFPEREEGLNAPGLCRVLSFETLLEGWTRDRDPRGRACVLERIPPQPTCREEPCFHLGCRAVLHFRGAVELSPGQARLWPSCFFRQERLGLRSHNEDGRRKLDQFEPKPRLDFEGAVESHSVRFSKRPVAGRPNVFEFDFYDLPGWAENYWNGQPNATAPKWFPLDFHYMYRTYLGPKRREIGDSEYLYWRVDMEAQVEPPLGFPGNRQQLQTAADWRRFEAELGNR